MYIKLVIIEGFKSYKEQTSTQPFSPKVNCVVGANGSGKSNFFQAIRFVLSDLFHTLRIEDRRALLHEGAGNQVLSSFVEIVFDNSDKRIPVEKEEVRLRRSIGLKKDEYFLDGKHISKNEVMSLLESAGFSRSNPYYVVQQGKIASLTLMKDAQRLNLLKEIGGTRVYEEKRSESLKIIQETGKKRRRIIQDVKYVDERLREMDEEKEELRQYQQLDKKRKALEYAIYDKKLVDAQKKLAEVDDDRARVSEKSRKTYDCVLETQTKVEDLDSKFAELGIDHEGKIKEKEETEKRRKQAIKRSAQLELDHQVINDKIKKQNVEREGLAIQLDIVKQKIKECTEKHDSIKPVYDRMMKEEEELSSLVRKHEKQLSILNQKQGWTTQFSSKTARDEWFRKEIDDLELVLSTNRSQEEKLQYEMNQLDAQLSDQDKYINDLGLTQASVAVLEDNIRQSNERLITCKEERDTWQDKRKSNWSQENELSAEVDKLKLEKVKAQKNLDHATPGDILRGLISVRKICNVMRISGIFGSIIDLLECDERLYTAVEVTAGNSLFHVVVDSDETATRIIRDLNAEKKGRVTFIPLNKVNPPHVTYPQSPDVIPMLKKLKFSVEYSKAFSQVFGRTVICRDLDVAARVARNEGLDCITLEGDQVSKKGGMTGGFYDHRRSKLKWVNIIKQNEVQITKKQQEQNQVKAELEDIDIKVTQLITELDKIDVERAHDRSKLEQIRQDIVDANRRKKSIFTALEKKRKLFSNVQTQIAQIREKIAAKQEEMGTELVDDLTPEERDRLSTLNAETREMNMKLKSCMSECVKAETKIVDLKTDLSTNLLPRKEELEDIIDSVLSESLQVEAEAESKKRAIQDAVAAVEVSTKELENLLENVDIIKLQLKKIKDDKDKLKAEEKEYGATFNEECKELERLISRLDMLRSRKEEYSKKIRELGPLSSDAFETRQSVKELQKALHRCNEQLQQFSYLNKQALDHYVNLKEQREELQKRQAELDAGDQKIKELIDVLDQRKDESIERTFKGVARNFREVFSELVQDGIGFLVMMKKKDGAQGDDEDEDGDDEPREAEPEGRVDKYIGVKVKVSFTGQGETQSMKQLSGGQKTVVALALIFAIQRCDPAPFYLFDEIDAALDSQYRTAVGNMIRVSADQANTQFITTTFRPELVRVADRTYGVTLKNGISNVNLVSKDKALDFIEHDQSHNAE